MKASANRIGGKLFKPMTMWQVIKDEPAAYRDILFRYVAIFAATPPAAAIAGRYILGHTLSNGVVRPSFGYIAFTN